MSNEVTMPLTGHLTELRNRVLIIFGTVVGLFLITYFFSGELLILAQRPIAGQNLVFLSPTEAFFTRLKIAFYAALFIGLPIILLQIWQFCAPGLLGREKRYALHERWRDSQAGATTSRKHREFARMSAFQGESRHWNRAGRPMRVHGGGSRVPSLPRQPLFHLPPCNTDASASPVSRSAPSPSARG